MMLELDRIICGDCLELLPSLPEDSIDAIVTDPPAGIAFMGKEWDKDKGGRDKWIAWMEEVAFGCLRVVKPGGHALVWALPRTSHWTGMAWENAGWEPRDKISHVFGSGFPKSLDISKVLDKMAGAEREVIGKIDKLQSYGQGVNSVYGGGPDKDHEMLITAPATPAAIQWAGFGTALKPAHEDWWLFRKPLDQPTIASNVLRWGTGALNVDGCRISPINDEPNAREHKGTSMGYHGGIKENAPWRGQTGRFPANLIHSGDECILAEFAKAGSSITGNRSKRSQEAEVKGTNWLSNNHKSKEYPGESGSPARFFQACPFTEEDIPAFLYYAKASRAEREVGLDGMPILAAKNHTTGNNGEGDHRTIGRATTLEKSPLRMAKNSHPTIKPLSLMRYLCRLITPPGGLILDPFAGSGTTCLAAKQEGFRFVGIEKEPEYAEIARRRIAAIPTSLSRWEEDARP